MNNELKQLLNELNQQLSDVYGQRLVQLLLYGSQSRGTAEPDSDIDVLVVLEGPVSPTDEIHRTSHIVADLSLNYDRVISCVFVSQEEMMHDAGPFLSNVRQEGVPIS